MRTDEGRRERMVGEIASGKEDWESPGIHFPVVCWSSRQRASLDKRSIFNLQKQTYGRKWRLLSQSSVSVIQLGSVSDHARSLRTEYFIHDCLTGSTLYEAIHCIRYRSHNDHKYRIILHCTAVIMQLTRLETKRFEISR